MKSFKFLKTVPGALMATAVAVAGSAGVYALSNWFGGDVTVTQTNPTILTVDMSSCKDSTLPSGVDPAEDLQHVKFKITGSPHLSADQLQQKLLASCENSAVAKFYGAQFPEALFSPASHATFATAAKYLLTPAKVVRLGADGTVTLQSTGSKAEAFGTRTFRLADDVTVYDASKAVSSQDLHVGDWVQFVAYSAATKSVPTEGTSILDASDVRVQSLFKTQYNDGTVLDYGADNVMPLTAYNQPKYPN
jgi:hypothetical protein